MSESLTIDTVAPTRRSRAERPEREVHTNETPIVEAPTSISPEDALADVTRQLGEKDRQVADARRAARDAEQRREAAETEARQAQAARATDHQTVAASAIEAARADQAAARIAKRTAREAGDLDAEFTADEQLQSATYRIVQATSELERLKSAPKPVAPQQNGGGPSEAAQRWMDEHPRFYDPNDTYQGDALDAHAAALRRGLRDGSPEYIRHIDQTMTRLYGEGHGQSGGAARTEEPAPMAQQPRQSSAAPPARSQSGAAPGGYKRVSTLFGPVDVRYQGGKIAGVRFTSSAQHENFVEGAKLDKRYESDPDRTLADYAMDHVQIGLERAAGGSGDLVVGDGGRYE